MIDHGANRKNLGKPSLPAAFRSSARTHAGASRETNQDAFLSRNDLGLWAVADGMGGHASGEVASRMLTEGMETINAESDLGRMGAQVQAKIQETHDVMTQCASDDDALNAMGSTIVVLLGGRDKIECIWAGDSRIYRYREGRMTQLTRDHSLVQQMIDSGALDEETARNHPQRNVITRAVGAQSSLALDSRSDSLASGDKYLLCTDGLYNMLSDDELCKLISAGPINEAADLLMATALARGADDNVTLILVEVVNDGKAQRNEP